MEVLNTDTKEEHPNHLAAKYMQHIAEKREESDISSLMLEVDILTSDCVPYFLDLGAPDLQNSCVYPPNYPHNYVR